MKKIVLMFFMGLFVSTAYAQTQDNVVLTTYIPRAIGIYHQIETETLDLGTGNVGYVQFVGCHRLAGILGYSNSRFVTEDRIIFRHRHARLSVDETAVELETADVYIGDPGPILTLTVNPIGGYAYDTTKVFVNVPFRLRAANPYLHLRQWGIWDRYARLYVEAIGSAPNLISRFRINPRNSNPGPTAVEFDCNVAGTRPAFIAFQGVSLSTPPITERFKVMGDGDVYVLGSQVHDIAEYLSTGEVLEPADVVIVNPDGKLVLCRNGQDKRVCGIISTCPTILMGQEEEGKRPLAISGVVPCKVEAIKEEIRPGDILVTSSVPGHARKSDRFVPGTVLGKALEPMRKGEKGIITVLLGLE